METEDLLADVQRIRNQSPVVLNLTNYVAMDLTANALLALGASPVMAHAEEELEEMIGIASAVVLNIGTLDAQWANRIRKAAEIAAVLKKPVVFDPVGAGASLFRTQLCRELFGTKQLTVIRGNASEISVVLGCDQSTKGVDTTISSGKIVSIAKECSVQFETVIAVSGATDYIFYRGEEASVTRGTPLMTKVTGMGCAATSLIGAFLAVNTNSFEAVVNAMSLMGICGETAHSATQSPGSFRVHFMDSLYQYGSEK